MDEQTKTEATQETGATPNNEGGNNGAPLTIVDDANAAAKRLEEANRKKEELLAREEQLMAKKVLGGQSLGKPYEEKREMDPREYARAVVRGQIPSI